MSQAPSPYSEPLGSPQPPPTSSRNVVAIVAIICGTCLLLCGGMIGLGFYAVDRLADSFGTISDDWSDESDAPIAIEYGLGENEVIREKVGDIQSVVADDDLTYSDEADYDEYFYRVQGSTGDAIVVVTFSDNDQDWFGSVEVIDGKEVDDPRSALAMRPIPFDSETSQAVFDVLTGDDAAMKDLGVGDIRWISYEYETKLDEFAGDQVGLAFQISGDAGSVNVVAEYQDWNYDEVDRLFIPGDGGESDRTIYQKATPTPVPESE